MGSVSIDRSEHVATEMPRRAASLRKWILLAAGLAWLGGAVAVGLYASGPGERPDVIPEPLTRWLGIAGGWWVAITLGLLLVGLGNLLCWRIAIMRDLPKAPAGVLLRFVAGWFVAYSVLTVLAAVGSPGGITCGLFVVSVGCAGVAGLWPLLHDWVMTVPESARRRPWWRPWAIAGAALAVALWAWPLFAQSLLPNSDWDGAAYHLPLARLLFAGRFWHFDPVYWLYGSPGAAHLFYGLFQYLGFRQAVIPWNLLLAMWVPVGAFHLASTTAGRSAGLWAAAVCVSQNLLWEVGITPRIDAQLALQMVVAVYAAVCWLRDPARRANLIILGMSLGLMLGTKLTAFVFVGIVIACITVVALVFAIRRKPPIAVAWRTLAIAVGCVLLPSGLWYARNAVVTGDPLYPLLRGDVYISDDGRVVHLRQVTPPFLARHLPAIAQVSAQLGSTPFGSALTAARMPARTPPAAVWLWNLLSSPVAHERKPLNFLNALLLPGLLLPLVRRDPASLLIWCIAVAGTVGMGSQTYLARYLLPIVPLLAAATGSVLVSSAGALVGVSTILVFLIWRAPLLVNYGEVVRPLIGLLSRWWTHARLTGLPVPAPNGALTANLAGNLADTVQEWIFATLHSPATFIQTASAIALLALALPLLEQLARRRRPFTGRSGTRAQVVALSLWVAWMGGTFSAEYTKVEHDVKPDRYLAAREDELSYLQRVGYNGSTGLADVVVSIVRGVDAGQIPRSSVLLAISPVMVDLLPIRCLPDASAVGQRWLTVMIQADGDIDRAAIDLRKQGVTHLLVDPGFMVWASRHYSVDSRSLAYDLLSLQEFQRRYTSRSSVNGLLKLSSQPADEPASTPSTGATRLPR